MALERIRSQYLVIGLCPRFSSYCDLAEPIPTSFPLEGVNNLRSILVVRRDSPIRNRELQGQTVALGQPGSATGYYFPIYNLYGLELSEIMLVTTPKTVLERVAQGNATAGVSRGKNLIPTVHSWARQSSVCSSLTLIMFHLVSFWLRLLAEKAPEQIYKAMSEAPSSLAEAGYIPNAPLPDYRYMISV